MVKSTTKQSTSQSSFRPPTRTTAAPKAVKSAHPYHDEFHKCSNGAHCAIELCAALEEFHNKVNALLVSRSRGTRDRIEVKDRIVELGSHLEYLLK